MPRTSADIVAELHTLLSAAGVKGPFILGARSLGTLFAYHYARAYPGQVLGLVSVDGLPATLKQRLPASCGTNSSSSSLSAPSRCRREESRGIQPWLQPGQGRKHRFRPPDSPDHSLAEKQDPAVPPAVVTKWQPSQEAFAKRFPRSEVNGTTHYLQNERPDVVAKAVIDLMADTAASGRGK
ncbi:alpha/beta fold hydrolase [Streptomyces sp. NPDC008121]|uniref:alpha/beta fold hydrolase n=1 Tax=Streptomyces sp. NPDC008121 TaxID=3364809 RepID=UPI0036E14B84